MLQTTTTMEEVMTTVKPRLGVTLLMREPMVTITCSLTSYLQLNIYITICHPLAVADEAQRDAEAAPDQDAVHGARHVVVQGAAVDVPDGHQGAWGQHAG